MGGCERMKSTTSLDGRGDAVQVEGRGDAPEIEIGNSP
jgi:hypothetical protein